MEDSHIYFWNDETGNKRDIPKDTSEQLQQEQTSSDDK